MSIMGNIVGGSAPLKTVIIQDKDGNEFTGVITDREMIFDATPNDVKIGKVFASDDGVGTGTDTKTYRVQTGTKAIRANEEFKIILSDYNMYNYSQLQAMIMPYETNMNNSTSVNKVVINNNVYNTGSNIVVSVVSKDDVNKAINLGIINESTPHIVRYFLYKEELL